MGEPMAAGAHATPMCTRFGSGTARQAGMHACMHACMRVSLACHAAHGQQPIEHLISACIPALGTPRACQSERCAPPRPPPYLSSCSLLVGTPPCNQPSELPEHHLTLYGEPRAYRKWATPSPLPRCLGGGACVSDAPGSTASTISAPAIACARPTASIASSNTAGAAVSGLGLGGCGMSRSSSTADGNTSSSCALARMQGRQCGAACLIVASCAT